VWQAGGATALFIAEFGAAGYAIAGPAIFAGLTLFDFQRLRQTEDIRTAPLLAASIFLDILNVFLLFLSIFDRGNQRGKGRSVRAPMPSPVPRVPEEVAPLAAASVRARPGGATERGHRRQLPVWGYLEGRLERLPIEGSELTREEAERLSLEGHVRHRLTQVVERELRELPVGGLDETMREIRHQKAGVRCPASRAPGQLAYEARVCGVPASPEDERPRLRVARRRRPPCCFEEQRNMGFVQYVTGVERGRAVPSPENGMETGHDWVERAEDVDPSAPARGC
jgi:hypothetical protein